MGNYRVRFAPEKRSSGCSGSQKPPVLDTRDEAPPRRFYKSRYGCRECKQSRLKCDETYPICLRCYRLGLVCHAAAREQRWQMQLPAPAFSPHRQRSSSPLCGPEPLLRDNDETRLVRYWLDKASRIFMPSDDENSLAYPIVERLSTSRSLLCAIKSISSAHQHFFQTSQIHASLEERTKAIGALREELGSGSQALHTLFLSVYLLGVSSSYLDDRHIDFGQEHLDAARAIVRLIIADKGHRRDPLTPFIVGTYVYWDMSCAILVSPGGTLVDDFSGDIYGFIVDEMSAFHHPSNGPCTELFFILATLGRYVRIMMSHGIRDYALELSFWEKLLLWTCPDSYSDSMWTHTAEAFRKHGLIMLCRYSYAADLEDPLATLIEGGTRAGAAGTSPEIESLTRQYAGDIMASLSHVPVTSMHLALQPIPLLTAGAELTTEDRHLQDQVKSRLLALYSCSRIPSNLAAAYLIEGTWRSRVGGDNMTWPELLDVNNLKLRMG